MKIATLTWYRGNNYGSILQAYALPTVVRSMGYDCEILAYTPTKIDNWKMKIKNRAFREFVEYKVNELCMKISHRKVDAAAGQLQVFESFRKEQMQISPICSTAEELRAANKRYDAFICGSDQIWNPSVFDPVYFLNFVPEAHRKIAYAPSLGVSQIPVHVRNDMKKVASSFTMLSVREQKGADLLRELTGLNAKVVVDPTLLLTRQQWECIAKPVNADTKKPYLFCYFLSKNKEYMEHARRIATQWGLKIRMLPMVAADFAKPETIKTPVGPGEWITLIKNADFVLTDSFHCTVFSIIFGRSFYTLQRFAENDVKGQNSRVHQLLQRSLLKERLLTDVSINAYSRLSDERCRSAYEALKPWIADSEHWLSAELATVERSLKHD